MEELDDRFSEAYYAGFSAYWNGDSFLDNPYKQGTIEYDEWRDGWSDSRVDEENQNNA
jgi:ribosome modulation factor